MNGLLFVAARHAGPLLRRRDRHGRQHLSRRPQRRAHADAVERRPQRGLLAANRQQLYLPVIIDPEYHYEAVNVEAQQDNPHSLLWWMKRLHRAAPAAPGVRARLARVPPPREPEGPRVPAPARGRDDPRRREPVALRAARRARPVRARGPGADRDVRAGRVPGDQRGAVLPHARAPLVPVVLARGAGRRPRWRTWRHPDPASSIDRSRSSPPTTRTACWRRH